MKVRALTAVILAAAGIAVTTACHRTRNTVSSKEPTQPAISSIVAPQEEAIAQYAGSESCKECHETAFLLWQNSNHGLAERDYLKNLDEPAFSPKQTLTHGKDQSEAFLDAKGIAQILTRGLDGKRHAFPVVRVIGNDPLRQFLIPAPGGRLQTCDVSYDPHRNEWFDVYGDEEREPGDWGNWTGQGMNWNSMCASCHNTRVRKNYDAPSDSYHTVMAEMTVGCEACHGPMKDHVDWQKSPPPGYSKENQTPKDPTVRRQSRDQMLETCAPCHSRRSELTGDLVPGEPFCDHFSLTITDDTDIYYPDGQVRDEDYEFTSFISSRMHHAGVRCVDCHEPHSGKRLIQGNLLCMRCHGGGTEPPAPVIDPTAHSHHKDGSTGNDCVACHMPVTNYMQRHPRHDHGFTTPDPLLTKEIGIPNACNRCHGDKDTDWAIQHADAWYGKKLDRPSRARARLIARARRGDESARADLIAFLKHEEIPAWRASSCHLLVRWALDPATIQTLLDQLKDPSPLVREAAVRTLTHPVRQGNTPVTQALKPMLADSSRSVRIAAAWALCSNLDLTSQAGRELIHMLDLNADQPTGRMQLGQFAQLRGDTATAVRQMRKAIEWDPNSPPFHHDLAILLSSTGDAHGARQALETAVRLAPDEPDFRFKLALACNETGDLSQAITNFQHTVQIDPSHARAWYNLGLARNATGQPAEAVASLMRAEAAEPSDPSIPYARATILARIGRRSEAIAAARRALQIQPNFAEARQLVDLLTR